MASGSTARRHKAEVARRSSLFKVSGETKARVCNNQNTSPALDKSLWLVRVGACRRGESRSQAKVESQRGLMTDAFTAPKLKPILQRQVTHLRRHATLSTACSLQISSKDLDSPSPCQLCLEECNLLPSWRVCIWRSASQFFPCAGAANCANQPLLMLRNVKKQGHGRLILAQLGFSAEANRIQPNY